MPSRRTVLGTVCGAAASALAGCSRLRSDAGRVDLTIFNQTATAYTVEVAVFGDGETAAAARAYASSLDVEPDGEVTAKGVVEAGRYLVRYRAYADDSRLTDDGHVHFVPSGDGTESLAFDIRETGDVTRR